MRRSMKPRVSIFGKFILLSVILFIVLGFFLSSLVAPALTDFILEQQELNAVVFANRTAADHLLSQDFIRPAQGVSRERFERFVSSLQVPGLFRIKIWNPEGVIVYSDKEELIGKKFPLNEGLRSAFDLKARAEIVTFGPDDPRYVYEASFKEALEVYAPVTFGASANVVGVIETYARVGFLRMQINELESLFAMRVIISLILIFMALSLIVWRASNTVEHQKIELEKALGVAEETTKSLLEARKFPENIIRSMGDSLIVITPEAKVKEVNQATLDLLGYQRKELMGQPIEKVFGRAAVVAAAEKIIFRGVGLEKLIKEGAIKDKEMTYKTKKGEEIPVVISGSVMKDEKGAMIGIVVVAKDMREVQRLQREKFEVILCWIQKI